MKNLLLTAIVLFSVPSFAGKMKEIWSMTNESVLSTLGMEEDYVTISGYKFTEIEGADLAVETSVKGTYTPHYYECVTTFRKNADFYSVIVTACLGK